MSLWIRHTEYEWRIAYESKGDPMDSNVELKVPLADFLPGPDSTLNRFSSRDPGDVLILSPALADRSFVTQPEAPLYILAGEEVTLYISSPLWVRIECGDLPRFLQEMPIYRPPDTWFGPSTREGELCYASRTQARLSLEEVPLRPHRVVTPVKIRNLVNQALLLERLNLPLIHLSLFGAADGYLWTQAITLERVEEKDLAMIHIERDAPREAQGAELIALPRVKSEQNLLKRVFSALFS